MRCWRKANITSMDEHLRQIVEKSKKTQEDRDFNAFCEGLDKVPEGYTKRLEGKFIADLELQPLRWMSDGLKLLDSFHGMAHVQLMHGVQGEPMNRILYYPIFQAGTEFFLKGMWMCKFPECRAVSSGDYIDSETRSAISKELKNLGHNLITSIDAVRDIPEYQNEASIMQFLKRLEALIRTDYFPVYTSASNAWANSRYPVRFYDDSSKKGKSDTLKSYPQQRCVKRLFGPIKLKVEEIWKTAS